MSDEKAINYKLDEDLIRLNVNFSNREELIKEFGNMLVEKGYVKFDYTQALLDREVEFPTGILAAGNIGVAIPHTDAKYVNETAIVVGILDKGVPFDYMGYEEGMVDVNIVFVLAINNANAHISFLQKLMDIFQNQEMLLNLKNSTKPDDIIEILGRELN